MEEEFFQGNRGLMPRVAGYTLRNPQMVWNVGLSIWRSCLAELFRVYFREAREGKETGGRESGRTDTKTHTGTHTETGVGTGTKAPQNQKKKIEEVKESLTDALVP